jgi:endonuclease/exonuclease/phosphatase family metal-dependent hydrolase
MSVDFLAYNTKAGFGDPTRQEDLVAFVEGQGPDVAFFAEAFKKDEHVSGPFIEAVFALQGLGYEVTYGSNNDRNDRTDRTGFMGLVRADLGLGTVRQTQARDMYEGMLTDRASGESFVFAGAHLDDRNEAARLAQLRGLTGYDIFMGDCNAMHADVWIARALRLLRPITERLPERNPDFEIATGKLSQIMSLGQRLVRMADGRTMRDLESRGLRDADPARTPTMGGIAQLDHIFVSERINVDVFTVHQDVELSDHKPVSATLSASA